MAGELIDPRNYKHSLFTTAFIQQIFMERLLGARHWAQVVTEKEMVAMRCV